MAELFDLGKERAKRNTEKANVSSVDGLGNKNVTDFTPIQPTLEPAVKAELRGAVKLEIVNNVDFKTISAELERLDKTPPSYEEVAHAQKMARQYLQSGIHFYKEWANSKTIDEISSEMQMEVSTTANHNIADEQVRYRYLVRNLIGSPISEREMFAYAMAFLGDTALEEVRKDFPGLNVDLKMRAYEWLKSTQKQTE